MSLFWCPLSLHHTLTVDPCRFAKQMRRLQITQFRNQTPPRPRNPICRSPLSSTKHPVRNKLAPKNQKPNHLDSWVDRNPSATRIVIDHYLENVSLQSPPP